MTAQSSSPQLERFTTTLGRSFGLLGIVLLAVMAVSVASTGFDRATVAILSVLVLLAVVTWASLVRPGLRAYEDLLFVRNAWSDLRIPWHLLTDVDVKQTLRLYAEGDLHHAVAVGKSARSLFRDRNKPGPRASGALLGGKGLEEMADRPALTGASTTGMSYPDYVVIKLTTFAQMQKNHAGQADHVERVIAWPEIVLAGAAAAVLVVTVLTGLVS